MKIIKKIYRFIYDSMSRPAERGEYSGGRWQDMVRKAVLIYCHNARGRILEIGCGEGLFLAQLIRQNPGAELYGLDNDTERLKLSEKRFAKEGLGPLHLAAEAAPYIGFKDGSFDVVICINMLLNLPDLETVHETLAQMKRVCRKGGRIIFDYRNSGNKLIVLKYRFARYYDETIKKTHMLNTFSAGDIESALSKLGLKIRGVSHLPLFFTRTRWLKNVAPIVVIEAEKVA